MLGKYGALLSFGLNHSLRGGHPDPVPCRILSSILGLYPLDTRGNSPLPWLRGTLWETNSILQVKKLRCKESRVQSHKAGRIWIYLIWNLGTRHTSPLSYGVPFSDTEVCFCRCLLRSCLVPEQICHQDLVQGLVACTQKVTMGCFQPWSHHK